MKTTILVAVTEIQQSINKAESIEDRLTAAMEQARNHWLVVDENEQFQAAIGAVLNTSTEEEQEKINAELNVLNALSVATTGVPVDFKAIEMSENPIGIIKLWKRTKTERSTK